MKAALKVWYVLRRAVGLRGYLHIACGRHGRWDRWHKVSFPTARVVKGAVLCPKGTYDQFTGEPITGGTWPPAYRDWAGRLHWDGPGRT